MANLRRVNVLGCCTFEGMLKKVWNMLFINSCNFHCMDVVYDSCIENSIQKTANLILVHNLQTTSIIPNQINKFLTYDQNEYLQQISQLSLRKTFIENNIKIILIGCMTDGNFNHALNINRMPQTRLNISKKQI